LDIFFFFFFRRKGYEIFSSVLPLVKYNLRDFIEIESFFSNQTSQQTRKEIFYKANLLVATIYN